ncbi:MAG: glycoside hydrolase family 3 C-terminal domain-containing protein [Clostridia bacterium]|nr:glycoside hydrolase family 3 C-terminal domain-containing protein [Clostridia bacterium]
MATEKKSTGLWRGLTAVMASLLAIIIGATAIVKANATFINGQLGITNYKIVDKADGEKVDSIYYKSEFASVSEVIAAKEKLAQEIASEGTVLFKNLNKTLPINVSSEKVTLWGLNSINPTLGGMIGSSVFVDSASGQKQWSLVDALTEKGFQLNQDMLTLYNSDEVNGKKGFGRKGGHSLKPSFGKMYENPAQYNVGEAPASIYTDAVLASADDSVALVVLSRDSSEAADYNPGMTSANDNDSYVRPLALSTNEQAMIELAKAHSTRVVVLINANNPIEIEGLKNDEGIGAIAWCGEPGQMGFLGVADVLAGTVNPSAHISDTFAVKSDSAPAMVNYGVYMYTNNSQDGTGDKLTEENKGDWYLVESEGIYTGYKYYETRYEDLVLGQGNAADKAGASGDAWNWDDEVSYSFGYGLSYTTFSQKLDSVEVNLGGESVAKVTVTNTGDVAGKSVAQLYVQAPYKQGGLEKAAIQLVAFGKTQVLEPGASETLTIPFDAKYFASYDENAVKADGTQGAWVLEDGDYYFAIGNGAHEALNNVLAKKTGSQDNLVKTAETEEINAENAILWNLAATDMETYSAGVQNQLQDMDINKLIPGTVEYTTRADWTKGWATVPAITPTEAMLKGLRDELYTLSENSGSGEAVTWGKTGARKLIDAVVIGDDGTYQGVLPFDDPIWDELLDQITLDEAMNFVARAGDDFENLDSIQMGRIYCNDGPLGYTGDQVKGYFVRWTESDKNVNPYVVAEDNAQANWRMATMPTEPMVAATFNKELIQREGELLGEDGLYSKESSIFAPGSNLHRTVYCARNHEYYSEDSVLSAYCGNALCVGLKNKGTMAEPKHFAFNHQESNRSGLSTFMTEQAARENELRSFQMEMSLNNAMGVMTAFNRAGTAYSGGYAPLLKNIARDEWGYMGWFVTDMINGADYMNWRDIVANGGNGCLTSSAYDTSLIGAIENSKDIISKDVTFQEEMRRGIKYTIYNVAQSNAMNGISSTTEIVYVTTWYETALTIATWALAALTACCLFMAIYRDLKGKKKA